MKKSGIRLAGRFQALLIQRANSQGRSQSSDAVRQRCQVDPKRRSKNRAEGREQLVRILRFT